MLATTNAITALSPVTGTGPRIVLPAPDPDPPTGPPPAFDVTPLERLYERALVAARKTGDRPSPAPGGGRTDPAPNALDIKV